MGDFGFWALAHENPDKLALVAPDGTEYTRRRAAGPDQPGGPRAAGARPAARGRGGHPPPQRGGDVRAVPGRPAGRLVPGPDQPPPDRARGRLHPEGLRGQGLRRPRAVRRGGRRRRRRGRAARRRGRFAVGRDRRLRLLRHHAGHPAHHRSRRPHHRRRHELHLGHHRQPQGGVPAAERRHPRGGGHRPVRDPLPVRHPARRRQRAHRGLAALPHRRAALLGSLHPPAPHRGAHGQVGPRGDAPAHREVPGDQLPHGPHPVPPAAGPARGDPQPATTCPPSST